jgi:energy-coupling factor transport system permease protein
MKIALPTAGILFLMQSFMMQLGNSSIFEFFIFKLTIENISYAGISAARIFLMLISFLLFILSTHPSELMTDLTRRGLPGQLAYVVVSTLQILPQMQAKAAAIISAQRSRGLDTEGSLAKRVGALAPLVGPLVFGSLVEVEERAIAIEARAFMSTLKKTSLKEVADTRLDKTLRIALIAITVGAFLWR